MVLIGRILSETPPTVRTIDPIIPESVSAAVERATARDRDARPRRAAELLDLLESAELQRG